MCCTIQEHLTVFFQVSLAFFLIYPSSQQKLFADNLTWQCWNNASCVNTVANTALNQLEMKNIVDFGLLNIVPKKTSAPSRSRSNNILSIFTDYAIQIPLGSKQIIIEKSELPNDSLEISMVKSVSEEGRQKIIGRRKTEKQLLLFVPLYLAANTMGWTLSIIKAVGMLAVKSFLVSKIALIIASGILLLNFINRAQEKLPPAPYFQHQEHPHIMPNVLAAQPFRHGSPNIYSLPIESTADFFPAPFQSYEHIGSDSSLSQIMEYPNTTNPNILNAI